MRGETKTRAIVLGASPLGESDLLVTFLTEETGLLKAVAKGALRSRKRFQGSFEPFAEVRLSVSVKETGGLARVVSADVSDPRLGIREGLERITAGAAMLEVSALLSPPGEGSHEAFGLLTAALGHLSSTKDAFSLCLVFVVKALAMGGYAVPRGGMKVTAGTAAFMARAEGIEPSKMGRLRLAPSGACEAARALSRYAGEIMGRRLKKLENLIPDCNKP